MILYNIDFFIRKNTDPLMFFEFSAGRMVQGVLLRMAILRVHLLWCPNKKLARVTCMRYMSLQTEKRYCIATHFEPF